HERPRRSVGHKRLLAIEKRDFRRVEHIRAAIALSGFNQEVRLDVAENRETECAHVSHRTTENWYRQIKAILAEWDVEVRRVIRERIGWRHRALQADDRALATRLKYLARHEVGGTDRAVFDVRLEVDADPLEEAVIEPDEANFDRDLQILQAA